MIFVGSESVRFFKLFIMDKSNAEVLEKIQMGYRMPRPQDCPEVRDLKDFVF